MKKRVPNYNMVLFYLTSQLYLGKIVQNQFLENYNLDLNNYEKILYSSFFDYPFNIYILL